VIGAIQSIGRIPELRQRILFTFGMLAVYRVGCAIVTPGINTQVIKSFFEQMAGTVFGLFNLFSGGALEQLSIFSLGIMPYISATIIFQLLTVVIPQLEALKKEGEAGQKKINQWSRYATIVLALFQSFLISMALEGGQFGEGAVMNPGWGFRLSTMITLTSGTAFIMWLGEQVTERGIGNGISLIIFSGIVVGLPAGISRLVQLIRTDQFSPLEAILLGLFLVVVIGGVVFVERGQRRIPIQHARRVVGKRVTQGGMSYFPLRVNTAGVIPPIFASSLLMFPMTIGQFSDSPMIQSFISDYLDPGRWMYNLVYVGLIIFFCFFYTAIVINPVDVSENIKRFGGYIPGIRPGKKTAEHIDHVLSRLTLVGAVYVSIICVLPVFLSARLNVPFYFGGTALLIVVGVALDTIGQIESHLVSRQYEGFVKGGRIRGRLGR
jgi:preprotein translocase subunit SecY